MTQLKKLHRGVLLLLFSICTITFLWDVGGISDWNINVPLLWCPIPGLTTKHTSIVFLKTHKTGSSTMQSILYRFVDRHNLTMALPTEYCGLQFCYSNFFSPDFVHPDTLPANTITSHMRFSKTEVQKVMPEDSKYITIFREPASMFESLFVYCNSLVKSFREVPNGSLETFLENPLRYYEPNNEYSYLAHNSLTFDLGGENDRPAADVAYAYDFVKEVEKVFSLVMISEYFDESLILLRHLLSWDLEDILYIKINARSESSKQKLSPDLVAKTRSWNSLDAYLYDYFNATLWFKLSELGLDCVAKEVKLLRQAQERLIKTCFGSESPMERPGSEINDSVLRPWQPDGNVSILGYVLPESIDQETREYCLSYLMPEVSYIPKLLRSQLERRWPSLQNQTTAKPLSNGTQSV